jgi:hypothetical protein
MHREWINGAGANKKCGREAAAVQLQVFLLKRIFQEEEIVKEKAMTLHFDKQTLAGLKLRGYRGLRGR